MRHSPTHWGFSAWWSCCWRGWEYLDAADAQDSQFLIWDSDAETCNDYNKVSMRLQYEPTIFLQTAQLCLVLQTLYSEYAIALQPKTLKSSVLFKILNTRETYSSVGSLKTVKQNWWSHPWSGGRGRHWGKVSDKAWDLCKFSLESPWSSYSLVQRSMCM